MRKALPCEEHLQVGLNMRTNRSLLQAFNQLDKCPESGTGQWAVCTHNPHLSRLVGQACLQRTPQKLTKCSKEPSNKPSRPRQARLTRVDGDMLVAGEVLLQPLLQLQHFLPLF